MKLPLEISNYIDSLSEKVICAGYLALDSDYEITLFDGELPHDTTSALRIGDNAVTPLPCLEGLLPVNSQKPIIIENVHLSLQNYFDIHCFYSNFRQWVVFIDRAIVGREKQTRQQELLEKDLQNEIGSKR